MPLRCLFVVQGEGRGHLTQALSLRRILAQAGHRVDEVVVGKSPSRPIPDFFRAAFDCPVAEVDSPSFVPDAEDRSVRPGATLLHELARAPVFAGSLRVIDRAIDGCDPDVVVNFFEPLMGLYSALYRPSAPVVAVAHQFMFLHPDYRFPQGRRAQRWAVQGVAHIAGWGARRRLALSLYPASQEEGTNVTVVPPLLREEVFAQPTGNREPFLLAYILNSGYADEIVQWHDDHPEVPVHCFWDRRGAAPVERYDETLTFHQLDDEKFLRLMARARGFVSTAGFESVAEALYLGTPMQVVPVEGHFEQRCNALDAVRVGAGIRGSEFDLNRLQEFVPKYSGRSEDFRAWVRQGRAQFLEEIEAVAETEEAHAPASPATEPKVVETV